jgi:hypothetical protein
MRNSLRLPLDFPDHGDSRAQEHSRKSSADLALPDLRKVD